MKSAQESLKKRLHTDTIMTFIVSGVMAAASVARGVHFFIAMDNVRQAGAEYTGSSPADIFHDSLLFMFLAVTLLLLGLALGEMHRTGKPFSKSNANRFRAMAYVLFFASIVPEKSKDFVAIFDPTAVYSPLQLFSAKNLCILSFAVVCALVYEIFRYGCELQDNMDSIA